MISIIENEKEPTYTINQIYASATTRDGQRKRLWMDIALDPSSGTSHISYRVYHGQDIAKETPDFLDAVRIYNSIS